MSYQKHTWVTNEIIRGKQLNHIEDGIYDEEQRAKQAEELLSERIDEIVVENGAYKVVLDHTQVSQPSSKYIYLEPDPQATGNDKFTEWVYVYNETLETYEWKMIGDVSIDLSDYVQNTDYASSSAFGIVKVDGVTITASNGVISAAAQATGVTSFNGRSGAVSPQSGDYTAADVGLENVGNFKAVSTQASQGLSVLEQTNARNNIGAGTSSFSGNYTDLTNKPTLGTAAALDVASSGNAGTTEVVKGDDTRLSDSRTPTAHTHSTSDITNFPSLGTAAALNVASSGDASTTEVVKGDDSRLTDARTPVSHTHTSSQITDLPTFGSAASLDVAASGDASTTQVVKGDDSRLTDARTPVAHTHTKSDITDFPTLATVATSGSYNDLSNKPTIPTATSDLTNDSGFIDYKAVSTVANQGLTDTEKANARTNIGAGSSSFSGDYADLTNKPTLGTAAALDVATSGDASSTEVVKGDDSRLTDSRTPTAHNHTTSDITDFPTLGTAAALDVAASGNAGNNEVVKGDDTRLTDSRTPTAHNHTTSDITNFPSLGTASSLDVAASGNAGTNEVVKGDDTRLTDNRNPTAHTHTTGDITNLPNFGTAASLDVAASGDASTTQVVKGDDSRLTNSRTPTSHTHTTSDITNFPTLGTASAKDVPTSGNASTTQVVMGDDTRLTDSRTPTSHTHTKSQITDFPTIPGGVKKGTTRAGATDTTLYFVYTT